MTNSNTSSQVQKAGAIVLSGQDKNKIALLFRGKQSDWSFPKGHVDPGETVDVTMAREIKEETGLTVKVLRELPDLAYTTPSGENVALKMFLVESEDDTLLRTEHEGDKLEWVSLDDVVAKLSYDNLKTYFASISHLLSDAN